jgi:hypothetical protein
VQRDEARAERWTLRREYRRVTKNKRVKGCGRPGTREGSSVVLRVADATGTPAQHSMGADGRVAGFAGLFRCGNVWLCMECAPKVGAHRAAELEQVLGYHVAKGGTIMLVTLTMRHHRKHTLRDCLRAKSKAWGRVNTGRTWQRHKELTGFVGYCSALEVTESAQNGWHVHIHAVLVFDHEVDRDRLDMVAGGMFARWRAGLVAAGMPSPTEEYGLDVQHLDRDTAGRNFESATAMARYITKGIAGEAVLGSTKEARGSNRSIKELMRDALIPETWENIGNGELVQTVDMTARARLAEYEEAIKGQKQMNWSKGLRSSAALDEDEATDEEVAAQDLEGTDVAVLPYESWRAVESRAPELLSITERLGADAARRWLDERGIEWWEPTGLTDQYRRHERDE